MSWNVLARIPNSVLDFCLALLGKEENIVREKDKLSNVSDLVKIKAEHANSEI